MKYLKIYTDFIQDMEQLSDEEKGRLFVMMLKYAAGEHPSPEGNERFLWGTARKQIDAQMEAYNSKAMGAERARLKRASSSDINSDFDEINVENSDINKINIDNSEINMKSREEQEQEYKHEQEHKHKQEQKEKKRTAVLPPTPTDIKNYCLERKNQVDYERFWDYYNDRNWKTRTGEPLNWKEKVRQWEKSDNKNKDKPRNYGSENYDQRTIRMDELTNFI